MKLGRHMSRSMPDEWSGALGRAEVVGEAKILAELLPVISTFAVCPASVIASGRFHQRIRQFLSELAFFSVAPPG